MALNCDVFKRLGVVMVPLGGTLIQWDLQPSFKAEGNFKFHVQVGQPGTNEWEDLDSSPVSNVCMLCDDKRRYWDQLSNVYYRVVLKLPSVIDPATGSPTTYYSQPQQGNGFLSRHDWLIARDMIRREYLRHRKRTNITGGGYILKRRRWGMACPSCLEYDTTEVQQGQSCPVCFGTGFAGGYFPAVDYRFVFEAGANRRFQRNENVGMVNDFVKQGRGVSYPYLDSGDLYIKADTGERFVVQTIVNAAALGTVPIIIRAELRLAPTTDIIYTVPMDPCELIKYALPDGTEQTQVKPGTKGDPAVVPTATSGILADDQW